LGRMSLSFFGRTRGMGNIELLLVDDRIRIFSHRCRPRAVPARRSRRFPFFNQIDAPHHRRGAVRERHGRAITWASPQHETRQILFTRQGPRRGHFLCCYAGSAGPEEGLLPICAGDFLDFGLGARFLRNPTPARRVSSLSFTNQVATRRAFFPRAQGSYFWSRTIGAGGGPPPPPPPTLVHDNRLGARLEAWGPEQVRERLTPPNETWSTRILGRRRAGRPALLGVAWTSSCFVAGRRPRTHRFSHFLPRLSRSSLEIGFSRPFHSRRPPLGLARSEGDEVSKGFPGPFRPFSNT